ARAHKAQALLLAPLPIAAVLAAAAGQDDRLAAGGEQLLEVRGLVEAVEAHLEQVALVGGGEHVGHGQPPRLVGDGYADHARPLAYRGDEGLGRPGLEYPRLN